MWMRDYFQTELNIPVYYEPNPFEFNGTKFLVGHGDGQGPGDHGYKFVKKIFRNPFFQWALVILPPFFVLCILFTCLTTTFNPLRVWCLMTGRC